MKILASVICLFLSLFYGYPAKANPERIQLIITGVDKTMQENIKANLQLLSEQEDFVKDVTHRTLYQQRAKQEIALVLQPFGYYSPTIDSRLQKKEAWQAHFNIHLNAPIRITSIHFHLTGEGKNNPALKTMIKNFPLKIKDVFAHDVYEQGKKGLLSKAIQQGYLNAFFSQHRVEVNPDTRQSAIFLTLETGPQHYFGLTTFDSSRLSEHFLERFLTFKSGDIYTSEKILNLQSRLTQSDYFSQVNVKALFTEQAPIVPIRVELEDAKPNHYLLGAGYGTDTGPRGKLGWTRRHLNQYGHRFSTQARLAEVYRNVEMGYIIPGKQPSSDQIKLTLGFSNDEYSEKSSKVYEVGVVEEKKIHHWNRRIAISYLQEQFNAFTTNEKVTTGLILPSMTFTQIKRDSPTNPSHGRKIEFTLKGSIDALFSDTSFFQSHLQVKWLHAFNESMKLFLRTEFGLTFPALVERLPLSQRFFAGGDQSLRGYGYRSLPNETDKQGNLYPPGGAYLAIGSAELVKTIKKPFGLSAFIDAGNAFRLGGNEVEIGTGVGIEWQTKLGPIKIAVAKPLTKPHNSWRIHASFGPEL